MVQSGMTRGNVDRIPCDGRGMTDRYALACTRTEYHRIQPITCTACGHRYKPTWTPTPDFSSEVDQSGVLDWICPRELCGHNPRG